MAERAEGFIGMPGGFGTLCAGCVGAGRGSRLGVQGSAKRGPLEGRASACSSLLSPHFTAQRSPSTALSLSAVLTCHACSSREAQLGEEEGGQQQWERPRARQLMGLACSCRKSTSQAQCSCCAVLMPCLTCDLTHRSTTPRYAGGADGGRDVAGGWQVGSRCSAWHLRSQLSLLHLTRNRASLPLSAAAIGLPREASGAA